MLEPGYVTPLFVELCDENCRVAMVCSK